MLASSKKNVAAVQSPTTEHVLQPLKAVNNKTIIVDCHQRSTGTVAPDIPIEIGELSRYVDLRSALAATTATEANHIYLCPGNYYENDLVIKHSVEIELATGATIIATGPLFLLHTQANFMIAGRGHIRSNGYSIIHCDDDAQGKIIVTLPLISETVATVANVPRNDNKAALFHLDGKTTAYITCNTITTVGQIVVRLLGYDAVLHCSLNDLTVDTVISTVGGIAKPNSPIQLLSGTSYIRIEHYLAKIMQAAVLVTAGQHHYYGQQLRAYQCGFKLDASDKVFLRIELDHLVLSLEPAAGVESVAIKFDALIESVALKSALYYHGQTLQAMTAVKIASLSHIRLQVMQLTFSQRGIYSTLNDDSITLNGHSYKDNSFLYIAITILRRIAPVINGKSVAVAPSKGSSVQIILGQLHDIDIGLVLCEVHGKITIKNARCRIVVQLKGSLVELLQIKVEQVDSADTKRVIDGRLLQAIRTGSQQGSPVTYGAKNKERVDTNNKLTVSAKHVTSNLDSSLFLATNNMLRVKSEDVATRVRSAGPIYNASVSVPSSPRLSLPDLSKSNKTTMPITQISALLEIKLPMIKLNHKHGNIVALNFTNNQRDYVTMLKLSGSTWSAAEPLSIQGPVTGKVKITHCRGNAQNKPVAVIMGAEQLQLSGKYLAIGHQAIQVQGTILAKSLIVASNILIQPAEETTIAGIIMTELTL